MDAIVEKYIKNDRRKADLFHRLGADTAHGRVPNSGMGDEDYRSTEVFGVQLMRQVSYQSFPAEVQEHIKRMQSNFATGLLSMISRAWVSIDCDLYLWNFELSCDVVYFDRINSTILAAGVTTPCATFPQPQPDALLTVITTTDVVLIGLNFRDSSGRLHPPGFKDFKSADAQLVGRVLHQLPLEGLIVNGLCCSNTGRIFFAADSSLYELDYYSKTWYGGSRCTVVNHSKSLFSYLLPVLSVFHAKDAVRQLAIDDTRHLLYVLFERGGIQIFDLGEDGMSTQKFGMLHHEQIEADVTRDCNVAAEFFRDIVSLCVVPSTQSAGVNFFVVTSKGVRIYFACSDPMEGSGQISQAQVRPRYFRVVHVRFPPPGSPLFTRSTRDIEVYIGQKVDDLTFMAMGKSNENKTTLWTISSSELWNFPRPVEHVALVTIPKGIIWEIGQPRSTQMAASAASVPTLRGPSVTDKSGTVFVLSAKGIYAYDHVFPHELFRQILVKAGPESKQFKSMLAYFEPGEICFMALALLCDCTAEDNALKDSALRIFFVYGGEPRMQTAPSGRQIPQMHPTPIASASPLPQFDTSLGNVSGLSSLKSPLHTSTPRAQQQNGLRTDPARLPVTFPPDFTMAQQQGGSFAANVVPSARHEALFVYFARIVGTIWDRRICSNSANVVNSSINAEEVNDVVMPLSAFLKAFEDYPLISPTPSQYSLMSTSRHIVDIREGNLMEQERQSMVQLKFTAKMTLEVIRLWSLLLDHQFQTVISMTSPEVRNILLSITFGELVERRESFCAELITSIMRFYISDEASTSAISNRLRDACPSLFTKDDALVVRATDNLYRSKSIQSARDRTRLVNEAVSTLQKSIHRHHPSPYDEFRDIVAVCDLLLQVHNFLGIIDLAIARAAKDDPGGLALIAYKKHQVSDGDEALSEATKKRAEAYVCITEVLSLLRAVETTEREAAFPAINLGPAVSIFPSASSVKTLSAAEAEAHRRSVLQRVFESDDELANVAVFQWLLSHNLFETPIEFRCRFFESFLRREITDGKGARYMELLWKCYEKSGDYVSAARTLFEIAVLDARSNITLAQRITYLSHALMCIQAAEESKSSLELKVQISDQLDVARVQQKTRSAIESLEERTSTDEQEKRDAINALDSYLYNLTDLYEKFADHFDLQEVKLAILRCAGLGEEAISDFGG